MNQTHLRRAVGVLAAALVLVGLVVSPAWAPRIKGSVSAMVMCDGETQAGLFTFSDFSASGGSIIAEGSLSIGCSAGDEITFSTPVTIEEATCDRLEYQLGDFTSNGHTVTFDSDSGFELRGEAGSSVRRQLCVTARVAQRGSAGAMAARLDLLHTLTVPVQTASSI